MALRSDPRRLPRRNHYQEGPGFLFLATHGGRALARAVGSREAAVVRRRRRALRRWADGEPIEAIRRDTGCSQATLFRWRARFEAGGMEALLDRYQPGGRVELPAVIERLILPSAC